MKQTKEHIKQHCGQRETLGSPICNGDYLCSECNAFNNGFEKCKQEAQAEIDNLKDKCDFWQTEVHNLKAETQKKVEELKEFHILHMHTSKVNGKTICNGKMCPNDVLKLVFKEIDKIFGDTK